VSMQNNIACKQWLAGLL